MRRAVLRFRDETIADWGFAPFQEAGIKQAEMLSCEGTRGVVRIHVEEEIDESRLRGLEVVQWWEQVSNEASETVYLVEFAGTASADEDSIDSEAIPPSEDFEMTKDGFELTYVGRQSQIRDVVSEFESTGNNVALGELGEYHVDGGPMDSLTERQREVMETALENGYYDVPRETALKDIAADIGLNDSTVSEHLQRAERNIITEVFDRID